jgi:hypothetical protein
MMHVAVGLFILPPAIMFGGVLLLTFGLYFVKRQMWIGLALFLFALILITLLWLFGPR